MNKSLLLIKTLEDIERKINSKDEYEIFMVAGLLRKLLTDGHSIIDQVNRSERLKISFTINDRIIPTESGLQFYSIEDGFDPDTSVPHLARPLQVNKDRLLKTEVMIINGQTVSVLELINFLSNIAGAVHAGKPRNNKEQLLQQVHEELRIGGLLAGIRMMPPISRVVLKGLAPLRECLAS